MTRYRGRGDLLHLLTVHLLAVDGSGGRSGRRRLTVHLLLGTVRILLLLLLAVDGSNGCGDVRRSRRLTVRGSGCAIHLGGGGGGGCSPSVRAPTERPFPRTRVRQKSRTLTVRD